MAEKSGVLQDRIESGKPVLIAEIAPPKGSDAEGLRASAKRYAGKVHALGVSDNRDGVSMAALAAAAIVAGEGVEPIAHVVTRDRNRIALASDCLGAQALGVRNLLCTTGTHQTLGPCRAARNVFDIDSIQLLQMLGGLGSDASILGEETLGSGGTLFLGAVASPYADPLGMQAKRLAKKCEAGARYLITQPIYDLERFGAWWEEIVRLGIPERTAIVAGIRILTSAEEARRYAAGRPSPCVPNELVERIATKDGASAQLGEGVRIALETIEKLQSFDGLRGFEIRADGAVASPADEAGLQVLEESGLRVD